VCVSLIIRDYSEFSQTCSRYALLLKLILRIGSKIYLTKIWAPFLDKTFEAGSKNACGGAWETENQLFVALGRRFSTIRLNKIPPTFKTPVTSEWRPYSVPTAFKKIAERRGACCANASNAVQSPRSPCGGFYFEHAQKQTPRLSVSTAC